MTDNRRIKIASLSPRRYHTLLIRDPGATRWQIAFGDYDKECVRQERRDSYDQVPRKNWMIITTGEDQPSIDAAVAQLNAPVAA